jgi:hypothetical protein
MNPQSLARQCTGITSLVLAAALAGCSGGNGTPASGPTVSSTSPASAATGIATNTGFAATFSEPMDATTITSANFTMTAPGGASVPGSVTYSGVTGLFKPNAVLSANTAYTATISTGAKSAAGKAMVSNYSWQATTGSSADTTRPTVSSTTPTNAQSGVSLGGSVAVTFSKPIDPSTLTTTTFTLKRGTTAVAGVVAYSGVTATFTPAAALVASSSYTATVASAKDLAGNALAASYSWSFTTGATADTTPPAVIATIPADAATAVVTNSALTATFSEPLAPASINTTTFTLAATGGAAVPGTVTYSGVTATFQPAAALAASKQFTATIGTGVKDLAGNALAASKTWSFTTGAAADTTPPTVFNTSPLPAATGVLTTASIQATFSEAMTPQTINNSNFTLSGPGGAAVPGTVVFDAPTKVATFQATTALTANTNYLARIKGSTGGVTDLAGNALASDYTWGFTSGSHVSLSPVLLGSSANYVVLAQSAISNVPTSAITGDLGLSPAAESYFTGFSQTDATGYATAPQVTGKLFAADQAPPTPSTLTTAVSDMQTGYTDAAGRPTPDFLELGTGAIGGMTLTPGLYKWTSTVSIGSDVTLTGTATDVFIFQISGDLTMAAAKNIFLTNGIKARNVFWQVAGAVDVGTTAHFEGIILSQTAVKLETGASMNGRILAQTQVSLDSVTLKTPAP